MNPYAQELQTMAKALVASGKGILAMDESNNTCNKRFEKLNIPTTEERHQTYQELILTTSNLGDVISSSILYDETIRQSIKAGVPFT